MSDTELTRLTEALARLAEASSRTASLIESRALPLLERIALALERAPSSPVASAGADGRSRDFEEARQAIAERRWEQADVLVLRLVHDHPDDPGVAALSEQFERARGAAADDLRGRIEAARGANDPDGVMALRDELAQILSGDPLKDFDRSLVKWLMAAIQRRLRAGTIRPDVVELASRVAERFGATTEGASLRAALPTLRRSAGLCPRCGEPYVGLGDACPKCLAPASAPAAPEELEAPEEDLEAEIETEGGPVDLNQERYWETP